MKKIFFDTEFTGLHQGTTLISLALVADSGEEFYAEFTDYNKDQLGDWIKINVIANLFLNESNQNRSLCKMQIRGNKSEVKSAFLIWINQFEVKENSIQMWADVPHYDWVLFCDLFGGAMSIPKQIHFVCCDLATLLEIKGFDIDKPRAAMLANDEIPSELAQHNALYDAKIGLLTLNKILTNEKRKNI